MRIYVGHSTQFDYIHLLYHPLKKSLLWQQHEFILPHDQSPLPFLSKKIIQSCQLFLAEVSHPSTGLGIELGWAEHAKVPIIAFYRSGTNPSSSLSLISKKLCVYNEFFEIENVLGKILLNIKSLQQQESKSGA